jgi:hypothetical protein
MTNLRILRIVSLLSSVVKKDFTAERAEPRRKEEALQKTTNERD